MARPDLIADEYGRFLSDHPGHPLGPGMPLGSPLRREVWHPPSQSVRGESHLMAWERICRGDPCAYCGQVTHFNQGAGVWMLGAGTADHIEPKSRTVRGLGGAYSWVNIAGACESCNNSKGTKSLLAFLAIRARSAPRRGAIRESSARPSSGSDHRRLLVPG